MCSACPFFRSSRAYVCENPMSLLAANFIFRIHEVRIKRTLWYANPPMGKHLLCTEGYQWHKVHIPPNCKRLLGYGSNSRNDLPKYYSAHWFGTQSSENIFIYLLHGHGHPFAVESHSSHSNALLSGTWSVCITLDNMRNTAWSIPESRPGHMEAGVCRVVWAMWQSIGDVAVL